MTGFDDPAAYGEAWAPVYDELFGGSGVSPAVDLLADLAYGGRALELGIGTGRVALPLAARGVEVVGVDASEAMVARLREKPSGRAIPVTIGDMADVPVDGRFRLVYVVANSFFALLTQARQVDCFRAVAGALEPGGSFVLECFVPDPSRFDRRVQTLAVTEDSASYEIARHDPVNQRVHSQHVTVDEQGHRLRPVTLRYAWPAELDLMAQLAGLQPGQRCGDWDRGPFDATSTKHVSIYRLS
ncbi:class I SAM-dependent DNA methyltransferase [Prauserella flavalba]|uniref:Methyltransferase n=1 Tax=Prauserella flavalba TaxID=1477506 RepID=A0A318M6J9_9PSEU|nr:class I SAM-dependent methyltransferase [Prauserella flavalba]PXY38416.1 methyltransferase [Prauserella flavalba]